MRLGGQLVQEQRLGMGQLHEMLQRHHTSQRKDHKHKHCMPLNRAGPAHNWLDYTFLFILFMSKSINK